MPWTRRACNVPASKRKMQKNPGDRWKWLKMSVISFKSEGETALNLIAACVGSAHDV